MGRLRSRVLKLRAATYQSSTSWLFLIATFGFAFCLAIFIIYTVVALSCVQAIGITLSPRYGIAPIDLFWYGFLALGILTFVNTIRFRTGPQHYSHRAAEALLIFFGLVTVSEWENKVHPGLGDRPVMEFIHDRILLPSPFFFMDTLALEEEYVYFHVKPPNGVPIYSFPEYPPPAAHVDENAFPLRIMGRPAEWCGCYTGHEELARSEHYDLKAGLYYGFIDAEEAAERAASLPPSPIEAEWCTPVRDLARLPRALP